MIGPGFAFKTCDCEDFPCCGHNDIDPDWAPDPYDVEADFYESGEDFDEDDDGELPLVPWVRDPARERTVCECCREVVDEVNVDGWCHECFEPF